MTEIEKTKEDIAILQEKLQKLEEAEKQPNMVLLNQCKVDIVAYDKRIFYRIEYTDSFSGMYKWYEKEKTFYNLMPIRDNSYIFVLLEELYQNQVIKQKEKYTQKVNSPKEDYNIKVITDYLTGKARHKMNIVDNDGNDYKPTPQTHEQVAQGLRDAMKTAKAEGVFDKPKPETLYGVCMDWLDEFHTNEVQVTVSDLVDRIKDWLPATINDWGLSEWDEAWNSGYNYYRKTLMEKLGND